MTLSLERLVTQYPKRDVRGLYRQYFEEEYGSCIDEIRDIIQRSGNHLELIRAVSSCFLPDTDLNLETGYVFQFTEPLFEKGVKNFDVLISNRSTSSAFIVESKTFVGRVTRQKLKDIFTETRQRIEVVRENISILADKVEHDLEQDNIEVALLVDFEHLDDVIREYNKIEYEPEYKPIILYYDNMLGTLNLAEGFHIHNQGLGRKLAEGIPIHEAGGMMDISCLIQDHPFQILKNIIVNDPKASHNEDRSMIKDFRFKDLESGLEKIPMGCSRVEKRRIIKDRSAEVIAHCMRYGIIRGEDEKGSRFHLVCPGQTRSVISQEIIEKYIKNWSRKKADIRSRERIEREYRKDTSLDGY